MAIGLMIFLFGQCGQTGLAADRTCFGSPWSPSSLFDLLFMNLCEDKAASYPEQAGSSVGITIALKQLLNRSTFSKWLNCLIGSILGYFRNRQEEDHAAIRKAIMKVFLSRWVSTD